MLLLLSCCERLTDFFISQCGLSETRRPWYIYTLQTRISMFLSTAGMMLLGCLVATPYQVICFLVGILSLRRRLGAITRRRRCDAYSCRLVYPFSV